MRVRVIAARDLTATDRSSWAAVQEAHDTFGSPFFRPEFTLAAASVWDSVEVGILEDGGAPVGFFPFSREILGMGRPVAPVVSDFQGVIVAPGVAWTPEELLRGCRLGSMEFNHLVVAQKEFAPHLGRRGLSPAIHLPDGYEAYKKERRAAGSEQIKKLEGLGRKMEREVGPFAFEADTDDVRVMEWLVEQKSRQCAAKGHTDALAVPAVRRLIDRIHGSREPGFAGMLSVLRAGDRIVAAHMGMRSRTVWHYWFPCYDEELSKYSPGLLLLMRIAQAAPELGLRTIDLGKGDAPYKERFMNAAVELAEARVELTSPSSLLGRAVGRGRERLQRSTLAGPLRSLYRRIRDR